MSYANNLSDMKEVAILLNYLKNISVQEFHKSITELHFEIEIKGGSPIGVQLIRATRDPTDPILNAGQLHKARAG